MAQFQGVLGLVVLTAVAYLLSENRRLIRWRVPLIGLALQFLIALLMLNLPAARGIFTAPNDGVVALQRETEASVAGSLMGIKTVLNEFLAYLALADVPAGALSERSVVIMSYALCGMANLGSVGIMIGGFSVLMPDRRREVAGLGLKSIIAGTLATCCTGAVVGLIM